MLHLCSGVASAFIRIFALINYWALTAKGFPLSTSHHRGLAADLLHWPGCGTGDSSESAVFPWGLFGWTWQRQDFVHISSCVCVSGVTFSAHASLWTSSWQDKELIPYGRFSFASMDKVSIHRSSFLPTIQGYFLVLSSRSALTVAAWSAGQGHEGLRLRALPLAGCATLEKLIDFSGLQCLHLEDR